jgi:hypothetical protein
MAGDTRLRRNGKPRRSFFVRIIRTIAIALFFAFLTGFVIGSFLRREIDKPVRYFGHREVQAESSAEPTTQPIPHRAA